MYARSGNALDTLYSQGYSEYSHRFRCAFAVWNAVNAAYSQGYSEYAHGFRCACAIWKRSERSDLTGVLCTHAGSAVHARSENASNAVYSQG